MQLKFSYWTGAAGVALFASVVAAARLLETLPDRGPAGPLTAALQAEPIELPSAGLAPLRIAGAWRMTSREDRFGGVSGLVIDGDRLIAISDRGSVLRFAKHVARTMRVHVSDLPDGPGDPRFKVNRDAEAILRDHRGRGWWVAFENRDQLWLYDRTFGQALGRVRVPGNDMGVNSGIEALAGKAEILAFPENRSSVMRWSGGGWSQRRIQGRRPLSDAAQIRDGRFFLLERRVTATGFENALALVEMDGAHFRTLWRRRLPVAWRDNLEALAAEPVAGGGYRLWIMSDDNFHPRLRTVLLVIDVPAAALPKQP